MKTEESFEVIGRGEGFIDYRLSGAAYRNLARIAEAMNSVSWCGTDNTAETVAEAFLFWRMVDDIGEPDGAMEFALEQVAAGIDTEAKDVDEYLRQLEERSRGNVKGEIVPDPEEETEDKRRRDELDAAFRAVTFE